jgi:sulfur-carrier protein
MARAVIKLPIGLVGTGGVSEVVCECATLRDALEFCVAGQPRLRGRILGNDGDVWVSVFVNGRTMRSLGGLDTVLADGDIVSLVPPISGG